MRKEKSAENMLSKWVVGAILTGVFCLYQITYSKVPVSDAPTWLHALANLDWYYILIPTHPLPLFLILLVEKALNLIHLSISPLSVIQTANSFLSCAIVFFIYRLLKILDVEFWVAVATATAFGLSYGMWYFANGELHHLGILFIILLFTRLVAYRTNPSAKIAVQIGVLHAFSTLFHQEHALFLFTILFMMNYGLKQKYGRHHTFIYLASAVIVSLPIIFTISKIVTGSADIPDVIQWYFYIHEKGFSKEGYVLLRWHDWSVFRCLKGASMAICYGAQVIVDCIRYAEIRSHNQVRLIFGISSFFFIVLFLFVLQSIKAIKKNSARFHSILPGLTIWFLTYKILFNLTYMPESPEYHISSNLPIFILLAIGHRHFKSKYMSKAFFILFIASMVSINFFGSILPWKKYGEMLNSFEKFASRTFKQGDYFISIESGLDSTVEAKWNRLPLKNLLLKESFKDVFLRTRSEIDKNLRANHGVYIYNFIPSKYALKSINFYNRKERVEKELFERELESLKAQYRVEPIYQYWEETDSRHYLFDFTRDVIWKVESK